ncbi:response regulator [Sandaracinus amylolyticus]|uniref:response regulator n=1 Tax=Sandaracinus amylolyticus TaxID=927083 RepID=UPI001F020353|nr:response regulator [Sandaracinus amylolyticus]UJR79208.1 Two-component nitrogen fixation transcriptional regulator FixJ [Sandaracinus amylolyticus]
MKRVLVVEDDPHGAEAVARVVRRHAEVVIHSTRADALAELDRVGRDGWIAVIIDVGLADGSGLELLADIRARWDDLPALVVTGQDSRALANRAQALRAEFAFKPFGADNVLHFVESAIARDPDARVAQVIDELATAWGLTPREREIVTLVVAGHSRDGVMVILGVTENTLKSQTRSLLHKARAASLEAVARAVLERAVGLPLAPGTVPERR